MKYFCPKCLTNLTKKTKKMGVSEGYFRACNDCDEDFYSFELVKKFDSDREQAEYQNMCIGRVKAIKIMEFLEDKRIKDGEEWYALEDQLVEIIEAK